MRRLIVFAALLIAVPVCAQSHPLRQAVAEGVKSMAWKIKTEGVSICCCDDDGQSWTSYGDRTRIEYTNVIVVAEMDGRRVTKLRMKEPTCPVRSSVSSRRRTTRVWTSSSSSSATRTAKESSWPSSPCTITRASSPS